MRLEKYDFQWFEKEDNGNLGQPNTAVWVAGRFYSHIKRSKANKSEPITNRK